MIPRTLIHSEEGVSINGTFFNWEDFDRLEPGYHWDENFPQRIYRVDGERPSSIDGKVMLTVGAHVLIDKQGVRHNQVLPWAEGDAYCEKISEYSAKNSEFHVQKQALALKADIESYKNIVRGETTKAVTPEQKKEVEDILNQIEKNWDNKLKIVILGRGLEKYYSWEAP